jgi:hypothetical protein
MLNTYRLKTNKDKNTFDVTPQDYKKWHKSFLASEEFEKDISMNRSQIISYGGI